MMRTLLERLCIRQQMYLLAGVAALQMAMGAAFVLWPQLNSGGEVDTAFNWVVGGTTGAILFTFLLAHHMGSVTGRRAEWIVEALKALSAGNLGHKVKLPGRDEFAWMAWEYAQARKAFSEMVSEILGSASQLAAAAEELSAITERAKQGIARQNQETEQVATAMNEMSASIQEVARNAANAAHGAQEADTEARRGHGVVKESIRTIGTLAREVGRISEVVARLKEDSVNIGTVLDVIRGIAEQTNLLALNAAIEAARAGEQGRGFAVVADEVRTLASRTQQSTHEIQQMIERLQAGANEAVAVMEQGSRIAHGAVDQAAKAGEALESITRMVDTIKDMNSQIASAAEEQSTTAEEINRNVANINEVASETSQMAQQTAQAGDNLARMAAQLQELMGRFKLVQEGR